VVEPIYTLENCHFVGQFDWGLSVFWRSAIQEAFWLEPLAAAVRADGIQINKHRFAEPGVSQFELETGPNVSPFTIVQRVKGATAIPRTTTNAKTV
jgi:hypothetical protein